MQTPRQPKRETAEQSAHMAVPESVRTTVHTTTHATAPESVRTTASGTVDLTAPRAARIRAKPLAQDARRAEIIAATRHLLAMHGTNFTTKAVAEAAGIAEGTIFRVFNTKDELIGAVIQDLLDPSRFIVQIRALPDSGLRERTESLLALFREGLQGAQGAFSAMAAVSRPDGSRGPFPGHRAFHSGTSAFKQAQHAKMKMLGKAVAESLEPYGSQLRVTPSVAATTLWMAAMASSHPFVGEFNALSNGELAQLLLHGFAASTEPARPAESTELSDQVELSARTELSDEDQTQKSEEE